LDGANRTVFDRLWQDARAGDEQRLCASMNQSSSVLFQLFTSADRPYEASVDNPRGAPTPSLHTIYSLGVRMVFDWRHYY
jgi:hypothetical protein